MKKITIIFLCLYSLMVNAQTNTPQERFQPNWDTLKKYQTPAWFSDAKFGIFIHWGVYSVPAFSSEWYPHEMYIKGTKEFEHHVKTFGPHNKFGYKDFIPMFKAEKFNADNWLQLFKKAGAKYIVPVAEHHDGFAMYKTALSKWNAAEMGPHRDIIGELAEATRKEGLVFGVSSHRIEHWWFMNGGRKFDSDVNDPAYEDFYGPAHQQDETMNPEYMADWLLRCTELVNKYQPQLVWFDWWIEQPALEPYRKTFASYYYNKGLEWNKGVVINYKNEAYPPQTAVLDIERGKLTGIRKLPWQTDDALGYKSWGYIPNDSFKSAKYIVNNLIDIVSKNGNLLLNIGPRPDGTIPDEEQKILLDVGHWLDINGESIYGTRPWKTFGEGPTQVAGGSFSDDKDKPFTANDIRFTTKGDTLFAISMDVPKADIKITNLSLDSTNGKIKSVELIGSSDKVSFTQTKSALVIKPLKQYPADLAVVFRILMEK